ncbi:hypothetical protein ACFL2H_04845 [Planctomycetota bacterium]
MSPLVQIVMYGWLPFSLVLFREIRGHRAVIFCFVTGALFLPETVMNFGGLPDYSKPAAISYGVLLAAVLLDTERLTNIRFCALDIPVFAFFLLPIPSAIANHQPVMDGVNASLSSLFAWSMPYFIGRAYLTSFEAMRSAVVGVFMGGMLYVPFCLYEIRMSPYLNTVVYGFRYASWNGARFGGFRPNVFLKEGLELGMWMTAATLCGYAILRFRLRKRVFGLKVEHLFLLLLATTILCKATGALALLIAAVAFVYIWQKTRWRLPLILLGLFPFVYIGLRVTNTYDFSHVAMVARETLGEERAGSFEFRIENEDMLIAHSMEAPILGWTAIDGRNRLYREDGSNAVITDGYWVIVLGSLGLSGLITFYLALTLTPILCICRFSNRRYRAYESGAIVALSVFTIILSIDCLLNAFWTVVYPLCVGGLATLYNTSDSRLFELEPPIIDVVSEEDRSSVQRALWPPRDYPGEESTSNLRIEPTARDIDTIEDESALNETR